MNILIETRRLLIGCVLGSLLGTGPTTADTKRSVIRLDIPGPSSMEDSAGGIIVADVTGDGSKEVNRLLHMNKIYGADHGTWQASADGAVAEFWRSLIAGVAAVRFHRPDSGIGLSERSKNCMRATRLVERIVKFWDVDPRQDLLTDRDPDEAYLAAKPGKAYILFFTDGGSVGLSLNRYAGESFELTWVNIAAGRSGPSTTVAGGNTVTIKAPSSGPWAVSIVRTRANSAP